MGQIQEDCMSRPKDMTGSRFGLLTVVARGINKWDGSATWQCICDCGNEYKAVGTELRAGRHQSCGCKRPAPSKRNLRPVIFNVLEQIGPATAQRIYECVRVHGITLTQVRSCLWNCASEGLLASSGRDGRRKVDGSRESSTYRITGSLPVYHNTRAARSERREVVHEVCVPRFASVFHYAQGIEATTEAT
jgi:hypothetical protein